LRLLLFFERSGVARVAGTRQVRKRPVVVPPRPGRRPSVREIEPLFSTYDAPRPAGAFFDEARARHAVRWLEGNLRHYKGRFAGEPFYLMGWEKRLVRNVFGWLRRDGTRLYRRVYVEAPRKTGKTALAAGVGLYLAHGDGEAGPEVAFAAYDQEQAKIAYTAARRMTEASDELWGATVIYNSALEMQLADNPGGVLRCLSRDSAQQFGQDLHGVVADEVMTWRNRELWAAITTAQGAREQPLVFAITSAGWDQNGIAFEMHELTRQIQEGTAEDPAFLGVVYGAPVDADWSDERVWKAANPSLGHTVKLDYYRDQHKRARSLSSEQNTFRTLQLSQWVGQAVRYLDLTMWDDCGEVPGGQGTRATAGLDLSATTDLTAFTVLAGGTDVFVWAFLPAEGIEEREKRDRVPYRRWAEQGSLTLTPGSTIDYAYVKRAVLDAAATFDLCAVEYDRWNSSQLVNELTDEGVPMFAVGQGFAHLTAPTKELQRLVMERKLRHGADPLVRWCASNFAVEQDPAGNVKPSKTRSAHRIDPIVALVMAIDAWTRWGQEAKRRSAYDERLEFFREIGTVAA